MRASHLVVVLATLIAGCGAGAGLQTSKHANEVAGEATRDPEAKPSATPRGPEGAVGSKPGIGSKPAAERPAFPPPANIPEVRSVQVKTEQSETATGVTEVELGVPFYPGSSAEPGSIKASGPTGTTVTSQRWTKDDPLKVLDFYKAKLGQPFTANLTAKEPLAVWKGGKAIVSVSTAIEGEGTRIYVTTSPDSP